VFAAMLHGALGMCLASLGLIGTYGLPKNVFKEIHENLHIHCGHLELSLVKNSGLCSTQP